MKYVTATRSFLRPSTALFSSEKIYPWMTKGYRRLFALHAFIILGSIINISLRGILSVIRACDFSDCLYPYAHTADTKTKKRIALG